jgi:hypothetical protein
MEWALFSFEPCRLTMKSLILHMIDCWIHHNETPSYILSSHYQYTRVPWVLGLIKLRKLPLFASWWTRVIKWKAIEHRLLLCEFSGWSEWNQKKPNCQIWLFGWPKEPNIWLFGWPEEPIPNAPKFSDNHPKPLRSLAKKWTLSWGKNNIFGENFGKNPKSRTFAKYPSKTIT